MSQKIMEVPISGMHCRSCEILVGDELEKISGVSKADVNFHKGIARIFSKHSLDKVLVAQAVRNAGYEVGYKQNDSVNYQEFGLAFLIFICLFFLGKVSGIFDGLLGISGNYSNIGVVFLIGLTAGISTCMALVGGLVISVAAKFTQEHPEAKPWQKFLPHLWFNAGRVLGFIIFGAIVGLIGSAFQISASILGIIIIASGLIMGFMGLQLTGLFPWLSSFSFSLPKGLVNTKNTSNPLILGALTFFLPCGFTQAIQAYALTTGSPITSATVLGIFALGTVPGLLGVGGLTSWIKGEFARIFFKTVGIIVIALAVFNIKGGLTLFGWSWPSTQVPTEQVQIVDGVQIVKMRQLANGYSPRVFNIKKDIPVKWIISSESSYTCAASLIVPKLKIQKYLQSGENIIEFIPTVAGQLGFSCSMGMYSGVFNVQ